MIKKNRETKPISYWPPRIFAIIFVILMLALTYKDILVFINQYPLMIDFMMVLVIIAIMVMTWGKRDRFPGLTFLLLGVLYFLLMRHRLLMASVISTCACLGGIGLMFLLDDYEIAMATRDRRRRIFWRYILRLIRRKIQKFSRKCFRIMRRNIRKLYRAVALFVWRRERRLFRFVRRILKKSGEYIWKKQRKMFRILFRKKKYFLRSNQRKNSARSFRRAKLIDQDLSYIDKN